MGQNDTNSEDVVKAAGAREAENGRPSSSDDVPVETPEERAEAAETERTLIHDAVVGVVGTDQAWVQDAMVGVLGASKAEVKDSFVLLGSAGQVKGENVTVLLTPITAAAFGAALGLVLTIFGRVFRA